MDNQIQGIIEAFLTSEQFQNTITTLVHNVLQEQQQPIQVQPIIHMPPQAPQHSVKLPLPEKFDGNSFNFTNFVNSLNLYIDSQAQAFPNNQSRVSLALSLLNLSIPRSACPILEDPDHPARQTLPALIQSMRQMFDDPDIQRTAERKITALKQTKSARDYLKSFRQIMVDLDWNDEAYKAKFKDGLKDSVKDVLATVVNEPQTFNEFTELAIKIDNNLHARFQEKKSKSKSTFIPPTSSSASTSSPPDDPMQIDSLTQSLSLLRRTRS